MASMVLARTSGGLARRPMTPLRCLTVISSPRPAAYSRERPPTTSSGFHSSAVAFSSSSSPSSPPPLPPASSWTDSILSLMDPVVPYIHALPDYLHLAGPHSYALSIVALTFVLRSTATLPFQLWARRRQARLQEEVMPRWNVLKGREGLPLTRMKLARREGKSFEVYKAELEEELRERLRALIKEHRCEQWKTLLIPISVSLPLFVATTMALRQGCLPPSPLLGEILPWWSPPDDSLVRSFETSAQMLRDRGMDPEALAALSKPMGPTLGDRDSTVLGPVAVGMLSMLNVEIGARARRKGLEDAKAKREGQGKEEGKESLGDVATRVEKAELVSNAIATGMRGFSILFIPISLNAPGALLIYWLSSISYSLGYNVITSLLSARQRKLRLEGSAQEAESSRVAGIEEQVRSELREMEEKSKLQLRGDVMGGQTAPQAVNTATAKDATAGMHDGANTAGPTRPPASNNSIRPPPAVAKPNPSATFTFPQAPERSAAKRKRR